MANNQLLCFAWLSGLCLICSYPTYAACAYGLTLPHLPLPFMWLPQSLEHVCSFLSHVTFA